MKPHIDVVGIRSHNQSLQTDTKLDSLDEYWDISKKIISSYAPKLCRGLREEMLRNDDAISNIAYHIMLADCKFNGNGSIYGFRKDRAQYAIKSYLTRKCNSKNLLSLDAPIPFLEDRLGTFLDLLPDSAQPIEDVFIDEELKLLLSDELDRLHKEKLISSLGMRYIKEYYYEGKSAIEISKSRNVSRASVHLILKRSIKILRSALEKESLGV